VSPPTRALGCATRAPSLRRFHQGSHAVRFISNQRVSVLSRFRLLELLRYSRRLRIHQSAKNQAFFGTMTQSAKRDKSGDRTERLTSARDNGSESRGTSDRLGARRVQAWRSRKSAMF
jgi:hypothetical protein